MKTSTEKIGEIFKVISTYVLDSFYGIMKSYKIFIGLYLYFLGFLALSVYSLEENSKILGDEGMNIEEYYTSGMIMKVICELWILMIAVGLLVYISKMVLLRHEKKQYLGRKVIIFIASNCWVYFVMSTIECLTIEFLAKKLILYVVCRFLFSIMAEKFRLDSIFFSYIAKYNISEPNNMAVKNINVDEIESNIEIAE